MINKRLLDNTDKINQDNMVLIGRSTNTKNAIFKKIHFIAFEKLF